MSDDRSGGPGRPRTTTEVVAALQSLTVLVRALPEAQRRGQIGVALKYLDALIAHKQGSRDGA